jgi:hypothetical protein
MGIVGLPTKILTRGYLAYALIRAILGTIFPVFPRQKHGGFVSTPAIN